MWVTSRCRELSWTFTTKNWSISIFDQESTLPLFFCTLTAHTHTQDANLPLRCHYVMDVFSCYVKKCQAYLPMLSDLTSDFWALTWAKLRSKIYSRFKMISGPMLSTKYMPTCRKIHNHRKYHWKAQSRCHGGGCRCWWRSDDRIVGKRLFAIKNW